MTAKCTGLQSETVSTLINVRNRQRKIPVRVADLQMFAAKAVRKSLQLRNEKETDLRKLHEVFVWLISDRRMASLHRKFMHQTGPTDVLTFQHGEIFISVETARRNARAFGTSLLNELRLYVVHGLLHLHGFDDRTQPGARKMKRVQQRILRNCSRDR
jgi:probable rRNA maturation factor